MPPTEMYCRWIKWHLSTKYTPPQPHSPTENKRKEASLFTDGTLLSPPQSPGPEALGSLLPRLRVQSALRPSPTPPSGVPALLPQVHTQHDCSDSGGAATPLPTWSLAPCSPRPIANKLTAALFKILQGCLITHDRAAQRVTTSQPQSLCRAVGKWHKTVLVKMQISGPCSGTMESESLGERKLVRPTNWHF